MCAFLLGTIMKVTVSFVVSITNPATMRSEFNALGCFMGSGDESKKDKKKFHMINMINDN